MLHVLGLVALSMLFGTVDKGTPPATADPWLAAPHESTAAIEARLAVTVTAYLPFIIRSADPCGPIPGQDYGTLDVQGPPTDRPAELHADLNLALRGYEVTDAQRGLVDYAGGDDPRAPQLYSLFADARIPAITAVYRVYDWNWDCNCRCALLDDWPVTLAGLGVSPGEMIQTPKSGYSLASGFEALVLYASADRITLKYTPHDNVVTGYTIHVENVCVEPALLALYQQSNTSGRGRLPALRAGQPFGRARGTEIGVAIRDTGRFMDPRSRKDWWDE